MRSCSLRHRECLHSKAYFQRAEGHAKEVRRLLLKLRREWGRSRSMDDALSVARKIERLCRNGHIGSAEKAIHIVEQVELLTALLDFDLDCILHPEISAR